jgi:YHS domain-containing protein
MNSVCLQCGDHFHWDKPMKANRRGRELYSFCSTKCRHEFLNPKLSNLACAREGCYRRVPKENRMLCTICYLQGDNLGEHHVVIFDSKSRAHWERKEKAIIRRLEGQVRVYSAQNMTQQELSSLVPSQNRK